MVAIVSEALCVAVGMSVCVWGAQQFDVLGLDIKTTEVLFILCKILGFFEPQ